MRYRAFGCRGSAADGEVLLVGLRQTLGYILSHPMNRGRPISTLARFASWQIRSRLQDEVIVNWIGGAKLAVRRGMTGATGNIYCGLHEYVDMSFVLDTLKPGDLFVDIGANVGSYTVLASKACGADAIAIEPDPITARALRRNLEVNDIQDKVEIVEAALGAVEDTIRFTRGRDTTNRVALTTDDDVQEVPLRTLDQILGGRKPTILKIDVEGFEAEVLQGASRTLAEPSLKAIITETLDERVHSLLAQARFSRVFYDPENKTVVRTAKTSSNNSLMIRKCA